MTPVSFPSLLGHSFLGPPLAHPLPGSSHSSRGERAAGPEPGKRSSPTRDRRKGQESQRTYLVVCIKRKPPPHSDSRALPTVPGKLPRQAQTL